MGYIKKYVREMREAFKASGNSATAEIKSASVSEKIYKVAMKVCRNRCRDLDDLIDAPNGFDSLVSDAEWAILSADEHSEETLAAKKHQAWIQKQEKERERDMGAKKTAPKPKKPTPA